MNAFDDIRDYWDKHAGHDPLWAVLSEASKSGRRWDVARFFQTEYAEAVGNGNYDYTFLCQPFAVVKLLGWRARDEAATVNPD